MKRRRKKSLVTPLSAELTSTFREMGKRQRFVHTEIWARWLPIVGLETYKRAFPKSYRGTVLTVGVANSTWLQELSFLENSLLDRLAEEVGPGVVSEIRFVLDTSVGKYRPDMNVRSADNVTNNDAHKPRPKLGMNDADVPISEEDLKDTILRAAEAVNNRNKK